MVATGFSLSEIEDEVVEGDGGGEGVLQDADGVVLAEDEVEGGEAGPNEGDDPKDGGHDVMASALAMNGLHDPAKGEHESSDVADEFPRVEGEAAGAEEGGVHPFVEGVPDGHVFWRKWEMGKEGNW